MTERNKAAERLRIFVHAHSGEWGMNDKQGWLDDIDDALAGARRATVERIEAIIMDDRAGYSPEVVANWRHRIKPAILDEEAAR